ncbi:MAG: M20/M25/M40 family metallo-hydrolase [Flammeovirgaceae bacterium]|nr:M20/M25/M40 family metallo-hydrolase [Flammeovirgaceae bacterium]
MNINRHRLKTGVFELGKIGAIKNGGVTRLALSDEDKAARDLLKKWMINAGLEVKVDQIGNMFGIRKGTNGTPGIMTGSHLDTVGEGGLYDGSLGGLAGLELIETLNENGIETEKSVILANFTNEEGVRFIPDMMGSLVYSGQMELEKVYKVISIDGTNTSFESELDRIGYKGYFPFGSLSVSAFIEVHIEQGSVLEIENLDIGIV